MILRFFDIKMIKLIRVALFEELYFLKLIYLICLHDLVYQVLLLHIRLYYLSNLKNLNLIQIDFIKINLQYLLNLYFLKLIR